MIELPSTSTCPLLSQSKPRNFVSRQNKSQNFLLAYSLAILWERRLTITPSEHVLVVDLGGSHFSCALTRGQELVVSDSFAIKDNLNLSRLLPRLESSLRSLARKADIDTAQVVGVALGFPGIVDSQSNRVLSTNKKFCDAPDLDLNSWSMTTFGIPLRIENDARLALRGEAFAGGAQDSTDTVMLTLGTGIGGVAMVNGKLLVGKHSQAGLLGGHFPVVLDGHECTCGGRGCAESEASGWALPRVWQEWPNFDESSGSQGPLTFKRLFEMAAAGEKVAKEVQQHCLKVWATVSVAAVHAFDPELLLIGGGVMASADVVLPYIDEHLRRYAWTPWGQVKVKAAKLGDDAALYGGIPLMRETGVIK